MLTATVFFLIMLVSLYAFQKLQNPGYRCPACGTARQDEHSPDCSRSRHDGDGL
jgi:hypothetical protein